MFKGGEFDRFRIHIILDIITKIVYYVVVMINTNNQLENFNIYRDGELDKMYFAKQQSIKALHFVGHIAFVGLKETANVIDLLVTEFDALAN